MRTSLPRLLSLAFAMVLLSACGGGGGGKSSSSATGGGVAAPVTEGGTSTPSNNAPPTISGTPESSVKVGQAYTFQPSASDAEGDTLQFTVSNLPAWASFDPATGRVSGTPTDAQVGSYAGITITVSDGTRATQLAAFTIDVVDIGTGVVTLSWTPPTANTDGSALQNLSGYRVLFGRTEADLGRSVVINNASVSRYVVENLSTGTWYFAVVSVNSRGTWSALSNVVSKTVS